MLSLSTLYTTLYQILSPPHLHTALLFTTSGQLISYASDTNPNYNSKLTSTSTSELGSEVDVDVGVGLGAKRVRVRSRSKDDIRVLVGLGSELWGETKGTGVGMVDSELGRIVVVPILALPSVATAVKEVKEDATVPEDKDKDEPDPPLMLLALNGTDDFSWDEMRAKAKLLASHLSPPLSKYREYLVVAQVPLPLSNGVVPPGGGVTSPGRAVVGRRI